MHYFAINSILAGIASIFLGNFVYYRNPRDRLSRTFYALTMVGAYMAFTEALMRMAASQEAAYFWMKLGSFWPFIIALTAHFILIYTENAELLRNKWVQFLIYGSASLVSVAGLTTNLLDGKPVMASWGCWTQGAPARSPMVTLTSLWIAITSIFIFYEIVHYLLKTTEDKKRQTIYVAVGASIPMLLGMTTEGIFPYLGMQVPELTTSGFIFGAIIWGYAIWRHRLFALTPATAAESIIQTMVDLLLLVDTDGAIVMCNQAASGLLGYKKNELIGRSLQEILVLEEGDQSSMHQLRQILETNAVSCAEVTFLKKNGGKIPISLSSSTILRGDGTHRGMVFVGQDLTERKELEKQLTFLASHDPLTGLPNRRSLEELLKRAIARADRGTESALLFLDTDNFKTINDNFGHMVGDKVLVNLAQAIKRGLRDGDFLARTGGDEFAIVLEHTDIEKAQIIGERVRRAVEESSFLINANRFTLSVSIGVVPISENQGLSLLMSLADKAMYEAKDRGRNRVELLSQKVREHR
jgi:diguanylate cyclase (GGDEF)-like protein/PAS domain S-box-containing protein